MATRMKMLKLLQEVSGMTNFGLPDSPARVPGALCLPLTRFKSHTVKPKHIIRVANLELPDIPAPVAIQVIAERPFCGGTLD